MAEDVVSRRPSLYTYLEPLLAGRRVLEIGKPGEGGTDLLARLGVARVVTADGDLAAIRERFDVVLVPEADALVGVPGRVAAWKAVLGPGGRLVVAVANPERAGGPKGFGYYELHDAIAPSFARVQMVGVTPFLGVGLVEFGGAPDGLKIDSRLVKEGSEVPAFYVAVAGAEPVTGLGYSLVQLPWASGPQRAESSDGASALRAKLLETQSQAESAARVARAQGDEIEELRARLRRGVEDRAVLDGELTKLRQALAAADESVMSLTRRTAEEMAAVAEQLAAGLRSSREDVVGSAEMAKARLEADRQRVRLAETEARAAAAEQRLEEIGTESRARHAQLEDALERLRLAENELARARRAAAKLEEEARAAVVDARAIEERDRALAGRDDRIARLEAEKQDLLWRLAELEDKVREAIARAVVSNGARGVADARASAAASAAAESELTAAREARAMALEGFHMAATAHVGEITELRASVSEQAALVAELEDALSAAESRASTAVAEASTLKKTARDLEEADRSRRSRLAELEGKLLRLEHERRAAAANGDSDAAARLRELEDERDAARRQVAEERRRASDERAAWISERDELAGRVEAMSRAAAGHNGHDGGSAHVARELEAIESELRVEAGRLQGFADQPIEAPTDQVRTPELRGDESTGRLETLLGNYRQRAGRLRDDLEGVRRRLEELSPSEIAGFLEELDEDLAELDK
jgi:chromosome segregation ATPase